MAVAFILLMLCSCWLFTFDPPTVTHDQYNVKYVISGTAISAFVTMENESGNTEQRQVNIPTEIEFKANYGDFLYISAQNEGEFGTIKCDILVNGESIGSAESNVDYGIAQCSGKVGE